MDILDRKDKLPLGRLRAVAWGILAAFCALAAGLWQLQVLQASRYASLAQQNRIRTEPIPAPRGRIYDRNGRLLVENYPSITAYLNRDNQHNWRADVPGIARGLGLTAEALSAQIARFHAAPVYQPIPIKPDISTADVAFIAAHRDQYPELLTIMASRRIYPRNGFAAHLIGYVGEPSERQLASGELRPGAVVGKSGLEAVYNRQLMGTDGERRVLVDSRGRVVGTLSDQPPQPGHDLHLTVDANLQMTAELALGDRPGAVVALDPHTGSVLALVSRPAFDPNLFVQGLTPQQWNAWSRDPEHPLLDKAIQAQLAPGSVFKLVLAVAGLQNQLAENKVVDCKGTFDFGDRQFHCHSATHPVAHGPIDIRQAITESCDIYFYQLGLQLGISQIDKYAAALGLGQRTGIDLPDEAAGLVPSPTWKQAHFHQPWYQGETIPVSIGQGATMVTPVQLARLAAGIASGGHFPVPHLAQNDPNTAGFDLPLSPQTVATIVAGMRGVVNPGGTAASAHIQGVDWGGKTGTAQVISEAGLRASHVSGSAYIDNVWFVGVAPLQNPDIAVCVLFQHGAESSLAAQIAAQVVRAFEQERTPAATPTTAATELPTKVRRAASASVAAKRGSVGPEAPN